ncbi:MAG TPA: SUF system NifU family Fe-S cluster assembly protein [Chthoniobacteraceae bacterium]|nr:SUF system NifU family Fe-S cluster assembly protein [Chthoniobacteraceae bacterium]
MSPELEDLYQQVLLDHSKRPRNFGTIEDAVHVHGDNPSCGDEIDLHVRFGPAREVADIKFTGQGCAICMASASMMTMKLKGRSRAEATELLDAFHSLVTTGAAQPPRALGDLQLLEGVRKFPQRVKCAMLAWRAFEQALATDGNDKPLAVSTETGE